MPSASASSNWRKDFEEAQSAGGTSAGTLYDLGAAACMRHDYADALKRFGDTLARDGGMGRAYNNRGVASFALGQYENAPAYCNTAQRLGGPSGKTALFNRALTCQTTRDLDRAWPTPTGSSPPIRATPPHATTRPTSSSRCVASTRRRRCSTRSSP
ncbi:tetratricopeptide repeat protein [Solidesulfovibrio sp.]|uniref:tetratricopeptide repeat protein n=1 Tax=Solidesulfovibrio sp. TaxID=2910990 RepID=UPI002B1E9F9B|nr:tetratricopeptide repeat protein [Solidesulfovibrio sp.]MEA5090741.1 tetratricopeptide repeat protein [Solidesulfovibrio sp.]